MHPCLPTTWLVCCAQQGLRGGRVVRRLGVADGGAAVKAAALKKLQGDVEVDQSTRAKVAVRVG